MYKFKQFVKRMEPSATPSIALYLLDFNSDLLSSKYKKKESDSNTELKYIVKLLIASFHLCCLSEIKLDLVMNESSEQESTKWSLDLTQGLVISLVSYFLNYHCPE